MDGMCPSEEKQAEGVRFVKYATAAGALVGVAVAGTIALVSGFDLELFVMVPLSFGFMGFVAGAAIAASAGFFVVNRQALAAAAQRATQERAADEYVREKNYQHEMSRFRCGHRSDAPSR